MGSLLLFLNEVAGGRKLIGEARERSGDADYVVVVAPANRPSAGQIVDFESPAEAARSRVEVTLAVLDEFGVEAVGEVLDPDPDLAIGDAIRAHRPSEVLLSCLYDTRFGITRRDLVEWSKAEFEPETVITHIPVRIEEDSVRQDLTHTLVVANQTLSDQGLRQRLLELCDERPHRFTVIAPATEGVSPASVTRSLSGLMAALYEEEIDVTGQPIATDPFSAIKHALEHYRVDDVLISTLAGDDSKWLEDDLIGRVREYTDKPVSHLEAGGTPERVAAVVAAGSSEGDSEGFETEDTSTGEGSDEE